MNLEEIGKIFDRSWSYAICKKKNLFLFPVLMIVGVIIVLARAIAIDAGEWVLLSVIFLPIFLSSGFLLAAGVVLIKAYEQELRNAPCNLKYIFNNSWQIIINISYLSLPLLLVYIVLWIAMGVFYLFKSLPGIGDFIGVILAFAPFLLVLGAILLGLFSLIVLFFVTPVVALETGMKFKLIEVVCARFKQGAFVNLTTLMIGVIPLGVCGALLYLSAKITGASFFAITTPVTAAFQWLFMMIPFAALLSPAVIFFFNFATESFFLHSKAKTSLLNDIQS